MVAVTGDVFVLVYKFHVPLSVKVDRACSGVSCVTALVFMFLYVGLMAVCRGVAFFSCFLPRGVCVCVSAAGGHRVTECTRKRMQTPKAKEVALTELREKS
jgi:hypothetical protein